jgi:hypothetical protein
MGVRQPKIDDAVAVYVNLVTEGESVLNSKRLLGLLVGQLTDEEFDHYCRETDEFDRCNHVTPVV